MDGGAPLPSTGVPLVVQGAAAFTLAVGAVAAAASLCGQAPTGSSSAPASKGATEKERCRAAKAAAPVARMLSLQMYAKTNHPQDVLPQGNGTDLVFVFSEDAEHILSPFGSDRWDCASALQHTAALPVPAHRVTIASPTSCAVHSPSLTRKGDAMTTLWNKQAWELLDSRVCCSYFF